MLTDPTKRDSPEATINVALALHARCASRLHVDAVLRLECVPEPGAVRTFLTLGQDGDVFPILIVRAAKELWGGGGGGGQTH